MAIPENCTVLVIGGGPAGSFAATALARESIDVCLLEMQKFPRFVESFSRTSMIPSMRHFLKFIDLEDAFNSKGFVKKNGGAFRIHPSQPDAHLNFLAGGGPESYTWNIIRSEADDMLFKHAITSGVHAFDDTKVNSIHFQDADSGLGRPVSASWTRGDGSSGIVRFQYLVDASGRDGMVSKRHLNNRKFKDNLKNVATWGYWTGSETYGTPGTVSENMPYFETLQDASGWCWHIPLHDDTHSVGIVLNQDLATDKKKQLASPRPRDFYLSCLELVPQTKKLLAKAELVGDIKSASDWSYSASSYAFPYGRIAGDAGCFIDPYFSSGVHLAIMGGLSAAITISASIRGDCSEETAASWHTKKIAESYNRFFIVVSYMSKLMFSKDKPDIQGGCNESLQNVFEILRPVLQGTTDANAAGNLSLVEMFKMSKFILVALTGASSEQVDTLVQKLEDLDGENEIDSTVVEAVKQFQESLSIEESHVLDLLQNMRGYLDDHYSIDSFTLSPIEGLVTNMERGKLGLISADKRKLELFPTGIMSDKLPFEPPAQQV
ncbi:hypothetical protein CDD80_4166 [Ophiocordyceps camponoti-rufipedis]|uniref:FAD-binding domain-containing protein n=1 Tax=Ophiocordyceps camponoti-rufipedis TaxID=2004952 RepID=A0A2C5Z003_9HYPO|nr:hypothetical protein CDD80_4166 [Ophiocordyceps camponoti-rufipedis]